MKRELKGYGAQVTSDCIACENDQKTAADAAIKLGADASAAAGSDGRDAETGESVRSEVSAVEILLLEKTWLYRRFGG